MFKRISQSGQKLLCELSPRRLLTPCVFFLFPVQPQRSEAREPAAGREEQHPDSRLRHGVSAGRRQSAGDQLRVSHHFCLPPAAGANLTPPAGQLGVRSGVITLRYVSIMKRAAGGDRVRVFSGTAHPVLRYVPR